VVARGSVKTGAGQRSESLSKKVIVGLAAVAIGLCIRGLPKVPDVDSVSYRKMAEGRMGEVVRPYANRVLHPLVVRGVEEVLQNVRTDPETFAFCIVAVASLVIALTALADLTPRLSAIPFAVLVACPTLCLYSVNIYLQDLFALALTALFFRALSAKRIVLSLLFLFLLQTARESTVVIVAALVIAAGVRRQWKWVVGAVGAMVCAMMVVAVVSCDARPNIHSMGALTYLATKVIANGAENLFGVTVWSDTYARQLPNYYPNAPLWKMALPGWVPLGNMTSVGVYRWDASRPVEVAVILLSAFGVLPVLWARCGWGRLSFRKWPLAIAVAGLTGLAFLLLSPFAGRTVERQIGYAWPLFWLALPFVVTRCASAGAERTTRPSSLPEGALASDRILESPVFWMLQVACMWWPVVLVRTGVPKDVVDLLAVAGGAACLFAATQWPQRRA